jgi:hypothetical protein
MTKRWWLGVGTAVVLAAAGCGDDDADSDVADTLEDTEEVLDAADADADGDAGETDVGADGDGDVADAPDEATGVCEVEFWIWDLGVMPPRDTQICASKRGEGEHAHVWVEDEQWGPTVDQLGVDEILRRWDEETPAESVAPDQGIFEILTGIFGEPPDEFDGDAKIHILLYGMEPFGTTEFDGYFRSTDMTGASTSNRREMIHINTLTGRFISSPYMIGVMAHEFHHMLQWRLDAEEETWLSESFSELAMVVTGYLTDLPAANAWSRNPRAPLLVDGVGNPVDYGAAFLFGAYLYDRLSAAGVAELVADPADGAASVETAVRRLETDATFVGFFAEFATALLVDDESLGDGRYGFLLVDPAKPTPTAVGFPAAAAELTVPAGGVAYGRAALDGLAHAELEVLVGAGSAVRLGVRVVVEDPVEGPEVFAAEANTRLVLRDVPATATGITIVLATDEELPVRATVDVAAGAGG